MSPICNACRGEGGDDGGSGDGGRGGVGVGTGTVVMHSLDAVLITEPLASIRHCCVGDAGLQAAKETECEPSGSDWKQQAPAVPPGLLCVVCCLFDNVDVM